VFFDLDETLITDIAATQAALRATAAVASQRGLGSETLARAVESQAQYAWKRSPYYDYFQDIGISAGECLWGRFIGEDPRLRPIRAWAPEYQLGCWTTALEGMGAHDEILAATLAERFRWERRARHSWLFPETRAVLETLAPLYRLALITNGAPDIQRDKLVGSGLEGFFSCALVSGEVGAGKPSPTIFIQALEALGCAPADAVMIGDNPARDVLGANRAGIRAIWIRRENEPLTPDARPDAVISSLTELAALL
jgi:putative hydrolase of the HAD superfamily